MCVWRIEEFEQPLTDSVIQLVHQETFPQGFVPSGGIYLREDYLIVLLNQKEGLTSDDVEDGTSIILVRSTRNFDLLFTMNELGWVRNLSQGPTFVKNNLILFQIGKTKLRYILNS